MKKGLLLILVFALTLSFCACAADNSTKNDSAGIEVTSPTEEDQTIAPSSTKPSKTDSTSSKTHTHSWRSATCTSPKTCSTCGETDGTAKGHNWKNATCSKPKTCSTCGETEGSTKSHTWKSATCTTPKTCTTCGETSGSSSGHNWKSATCTAPKTCSVCGKTEGTIAEHSYISSKCKDCGAYIQFDADELQKVKGYLDSILESIADAEEYIEKAKDSLAGDMYLSAGQISIMSIPIELNMISISLLSNVDLPNGVSLNHCLRMASIEIETASNTSNIGTFSRTLASAKDYVLKMHEGITQLIALQS